MNKHCTTCRNNNESWSPTSDTCGQCLDNSEDGIEFPMYKRSLGADKYEEVANEIQ